MAEFILNNQIAFYYSLIGLAFMGLTFQPALRKHLFYNIPVLYIIMGIIAARIGLPVIDPLNSHAELKIIEHVSELIVIISLAGAGLAIDLKMGWRSWQPTWRLLLFAMPLTIIAVTGISFYGLGLGLASAVLIGAALAPTDPVLARSVSVGAPNSDQPGTKIALTSEAGLNDGLAFPFIWLAIGLAISVQDFDLVNWFTVDFLYRIVAGTLTGLIVGWTVSKILFSRVGDARNGRTNVALFVLAATFLAYGIAEFVHGYGFLSVFIAARSGRAHTKDTKAEPYENKAHETADQLEAILLAVILLWFGTFIGQTLWHVWTWEHLIAALIIIFLVRPILGWLSFAGTDIDQQDRFKMAFFGIRGMGSIFYIAFALTHAEFENPAQIWSIVSLAIIISALIHGSLAQKWMKDTKST
jgi:NhaP-type Na+/H+ or K+/H+ antiporter